MKTLGEMTRAELTAEMRSCRGIVQRRDAAIKRARREAWAADQRTVLIELERERRKGNRA